jgi:hypothetical protein
VVSRNSMLALWMYLLKNIDQISVLKFQELAYRMIRALLMRKEVTAALGFACVQALACLPGTAHSTQPRLTFTACSHTIALLFRCFLGARHHLRCRSFT